ncbi:MAG: hypothetical protein QG572_923 [Pseudomonadota bacterium]|jgi:hypothetical protein|nr:hypothetical protein [Pseudomonadota bacterium]
MSKEIDHFARGASDFERAQSAGSWLRERFPESTTEDAIELNMLVVGLLRRERGRVAAVIVRENGNGVQTAGPLPKIE